MARTEHVQEAKELAKERGFDLTEETNGAWMEWFSPEVATLDGDFTIRALEVILEITRRHST